MGSLFLCVRFVCRPKPRIALFDCLLLLPYMSAMVLVDAPSAANGHCFHHRLEEQHRTNLEQSTNWDGCIFVPHRSGTNHL